MKLFRVHASEVHKWHCDVIADSPEQAEKLLKEAWKRDDWTEHDNYVESGPVKMETPGVGLEVDELRTRELGPADRRMGQDAHAFYGIGEKRR